MILEFLMGCLIIVGTATYAVLLGALLSGWLSLVRERRAERRLRLALATLPPDEALDYFLDFVLSRDRPSP